MGWIHIMLLWSPDILFYATSVNYSHTNAALKSLVISSALVIKAGERVWMWGDPSIRVCSHLQNQSVLR